MNETLIEANCPFCNAQYRLLAGYQGRVVRCKDCDESFRVVSKSIVEEFVPAESIDQKPGRVGDQTMWSPYQQSDQDYLEFGFESEKPFQDWNGSQFNRLPGNSSGWIPKKNGASSLSDNLAKVPLWAKVGYCGCVAFFVFFGSMLIYSNLQGPPEPAPYVSVPKIENRGPLLRSIERRVRELTLERRALTSVVASGRPGNRVFVPVGKRYVYQVHFDVSTPSYRFNSETKLNLEPFSPTRLKTVSDNLFENFDANKSTVLQVFGLENGDEDKLLDRQSFFEATENRDIDSCLLFDRNWNYKESSTPVFDRFLLCDKTFFVVPQFGQGKESVSKETKVDWKIPRIFLEEARTAMPKNVAVPRNLSMKVSDQSVIVSEDDGLMIVRRVINFENENLEDKKEPQFSGKITCFITFDKVMRCVTGGSINGKCTLEGEKRLMEFTYQGAIELDGALPAKHFELVIVPVY